MDRIPTPGITTDQPLDTITRTDTEIVDQGCNLAPAVIAITVITTPTEVILGHIIETVDATIEALHDATTAHITFTVTHNI